VANHYTYRLEWSMDTAEYYARCLEIDGLYAVGPTAQTALARAEAAVVAYLRQNEEVFGGDPPTPLTEQSLHCRLMVEAAEQGVSLNRWVVQKLAERKPNLDW
jgi:predicted RNase H-like HicB family nuclease